MSVIVAVKDGKQCLFGSDRQCTDHTGRKSVYGGKWAVANGAAIAAVGEVRTADIVLHHADDLTRDLQDERSPALTVSERLRCTFEQYGFDLSAGNGESRVTPGTHSTVVLIVRGEIWVIGGDFSTLRYDEFTAEGSGAAYALGALHVSRNLGQPARDQIAAALSAAMTFDDACGMGVVIDCI